MIPPPRITVFLDAPDEGWRAMDYVGEMLVAEMRRIPERVNVVAFSRSLPRIGRSILGDARGLSADRVLGRFGTYPAGAFAAGLGRGFFHVVDHSYAQLVHALPAARTGVYCHDVDAFRRSRVSDHKPRSPAFRLMQDIVAAGLRRAAVVFYSTESARREIEERGLVSRAPLVHAPYGVSPEFTAGALETEVVERFVAPIASRPYVLHVGSNVPRKRLDVLFETFARLHARMPELRLVQNGATLDASQRAHVERSGIESALVQPSSGPVDRCLLAALYRRSLAVLVTSDAEGFGLPVIEALACGAVVFASDIPVLREVGGDAIVTCRTGDPEDWAAKVSAFLSGRLQVPPRDVRLAQAAKFTWARHARTILDAYLALELPKR